MAAAPEYSPEELNYFRVCNVTTRIISDRLREVFKQLWDARYEATHGQWLDNAKNGIDLYDLESPKSRKKNSRELAILRNGNRREWDCSDLFFAILYSDSIGKGLDLVVKKSVDDLRQFRNKVFAHVSDGKLTELDFQTSIQTVIAAFSALKLDTADVEAIKNQTTFPTEELRVTQQQLEKEKMRNEEPQSFCVLPPKPSHEVIDRSEEINEIMEEMKKLRTAKPNEITVVYLSGNPGCGKSEIARQIGEKVFDDDPDNGADQVKFVYSLNASSTDTLVQSHIEFAVSLNCDENATTNIGTTKDLSQEEKLIHLKSLVVPKLRKYSSWLLIVDNVTDVKSVFKYLPQVGEKTKGNGQILVTTQDSRSIGENDSYSYHLSLSRGMKPEEAVKTLSEISGIDSNNQCILQVAQALDFQPLALACAAVYMKRVSHTRTSIPWEEYLDKLQQGKRKATEAEYKRISVVYSQPMTTAAKLALDKEMAEDIVMKHAFHFLSALAPERIPLEYVVQYVTRCLPDQDKDLVAATVYSSSLILSSEDQSKEIRVHQVVHSCLQHIFQYDDINNIKKEEFHFLVNVINAFSAVLNAFDESNVKQIITTKFAAVHFMHISKKLVHYTTESLSAITLKTEGFQNVNDESMGCIEAAGKICLAHGKYEAANTLYKIVLIIKEENFQNSDPPALAVPLNNLGQSLSFLGKHEEAQICFERAFAIVEVAVGQNSWPVATTLNSLGSSLRDLGKHKEAHKCFQRALVIDEMVYDPHNPKLATTLNNLGLSLLDLGKHEEAQKCLERALAIYQTVYDPNHPSLAKAFNNLGLSLNDLGKHEDAQKCFERALAIDEMVYDQNHPTLANALNNLGSNLRHLGKHEEAMKCFKRALAIQEMAYDPNHPIFSTTLNNLGWTLNALGKHEEAQKYLERALAIREMAFHPNHPQLVTILNNLGSSLHQLGKHIGAQKCFERALTIGEMAFHPNHPVLATTLNNLGSMLLSLGKYEKAQKCFEKALVIDEIAYDQNHPNLATTLNNLGSSLNHLGKHEEAQKCFERALAINEVAYGKNHPKVATTLNFLGSSLRDLGKHEELQKCLERALAIQEMAYDQNHPLLATTLGNLAINLLDQGKSEEGMKCLERAFNR